MLRIIADRVRTAAVAFTPVLACAVVPGCEDNPTRPDVSDNQVLRLELQQVDDGTADVRARLGTINLMLEMNWTATPDPLCEAEPDPNATTFVATVEALPSRLQPAANGSANGTWNCFGFSGEVRLDDGTRYDLRSDELTFEKAMAGSWRDSMSLNHWSSGNRRGHFRLGQPWDSGIVFDTHLDAVLQNLSGETVHMHYADESCFRHRDLPRTCSTLPEEVFTEVRPGRVVTTSWYNYLLSVRWPPSREPLMYDVPQTYEIEVRFGDAPTRDNAFDFVECFLDPANNGRVEVIVREGRALECGEGWLGGLFAKAVPNHIYLQPGETDSADVRTVKFAGTHAPTLSVASSNPTVRVTQRSLDSLDTRLTVTASSTASLTRHTVTATLVTQDPANSYEVTVPVDVYRLAPQMERDTITLPRGAIGTMTANVNYEGIEGEPIRLRIVSAPPGVFQFPPAFVPDVTSDPTTAVNLPIQANAPLGDHEVRFCARIDKDPRRPCYGGSFVVRVTDQNAPPAVSILLPEPGYSALGGLAILFRGRATDPEEGRLTGSSLIWTSSISGGIGSGEEFGAVLPIGEHTIILTGTDSFGASAADTVTVSLIDLNFSASIVGRITRNGLGVGGATILLDGPQAGSTTSAADGSYAFNGLPAGTYTVVVSAPGIAFIPNAQTVTITNGEAVVANFAGT